MAPPIAKTLKIHNEIVVLTGELVYYYRPRIVLNDEGLTVVNTRVGRSGQGGAKKTAYALKTVILVAAD